MYIRKYIFRFIILLSLLFAGFTINQTDQTSRAAGAGLPPEGISAAAWEDILDQVQADVQSTAADPLLTSAVKKLSAGDGASGHSYGVSVAVSGDTAVIGAHHATVGSNAQQGAAYVYYRNTGGTDQWGLMRKLTAFDGAANDYFGVSVAISTDTVLVGAMGADIDGKNNQGAAYIYRRNAGGQDQWGLMKKIVAGDGAAYDYFGGAVAVSGWALAVGADSADISARADQGAAYVFLRNQGGMDFWGQWKKLTASDGADSDYFGGALAFSNDTLVVGAWGADIASNSGRGAAYIFRRNQAGMDEWGQAKKLVAGDGAANDHFGYSAAINAQADTIVIGANTANVGGASRGAAYVFARNQGGGDVWGQAQKLTAFDGAANDSFGHSVSINQNRILVGVSGDDSSRGAVYRFECNQGGLNQWGWVEKITAWDGASADNLGLSVSLNEQGDTAVFGAPGDESWRGAVYLYRWPGVNWQEQRKLGPGEWAHQYGLASAVSGDILVVGAYGADIGGQSVAGAAYLYARNLGGADNWGFVKRLTASDYAAFNYFGHSVAVSGDTIVIGAYGADIGGQEAPGAAYIFSRNWGGADNWGQVKKLYASDYAEQDHFGAAVAISGDIVAVGSNRANIGGQVQAGAAYVFSRNWGGMENWGQVKKLYASDYAQGNYFGSCLALDGDTLVVGAYLADVLGQDSAGAVYVFSHNWGGQDNWGQVKRLFAYDHAANDHFGQSVAISGDILLVGAPGADIGGQSGVGAAYLFYRNIGGPEFWGELKKLTARDGAVEDFFGTSVAISGDTLLVGAYAVDVGVKENAGAAYVYSRNWGGGDRWGFVSELFASDYYAYSFAGNSVTIDGSTAVVGVTGDQKAYVFYEVNTAQFLPLIVR